MHPPSYLLRPALAGTWTRAQGAAVCRLPLRRVHIGVPPDFIGSLRASCDQGASWRGMRAALHAGWPAADVDDLLSALVAHGILVGASQAAAPTFGDQRLPARAVAAVLRKLGVGAAQGVRWFLAQLRDRPEQAAGFYELSSPLESQDRRKGGMPAMGAIRAVDAHLAAPPEAWVMLLDPTVLAFAHLMIIPVVGRPRGRRRHPPHRSEPAMSGPAAAGRALLMAARAAEAEGALCVVRSDTITAELRLRCKLKAHEEPLQAWIVGPQPTRAQQGMADAAHRRVPVRAVPTQHFALRLPTRAAVAGPIDRDRLGDACLRTAGRAADARLAAIKAEAEGWERIGWTTPVPLARARLKDLEGALDPRSLVAYAAPQYARPGFPFTPFSERASYPWLRAQGARSGAGRWVMAHCAHPAAMLGGRDGRRPYTSANTSGMAAHPDAATARWRALVELVERDAFARAWLTRRPPARLRDAQLPSALRARLRRLRSAGYALDVLALASPHLPVAAVFAQCRAASFTVLTTGAALDAVESVDAALAEAESRIQQAHDVGRPADMAASRVRSPSDHGDYYRSRRGFRAADWFTNSPERVSLQRWGTQFPVLPRTPQHAFEALVAAGLDVTVCDLTPPGSALDQGRTPLHVARVFAPQLQPLWFGHGLDPMLQPSAALESPRALHAGIRRPWTPAPIHPCT